MHICFCGKFSIMKLKNVFACTAFATLMVANVGAQEAPQLGKASLDEVIQAMTLEEKVSLLVGSAGKIESDQTAAIGNQGALVPGAAGETNAIPRLGIPATVLADGPAGVRISPTRDNTSQTFYCTHFPVETLLASTWNTELVHQVGEAMGEEAKRYGVDVLLGPATNIHRNPLNGRNFEYYSEDPLLAGEMAAAMIEGVQSNGVGTSLKHFALNNQETNRTSNDVVVSPRTFREIYLKPFEIAVKKAKPWTIMSSYNKINGTYASERADLLTDILRHEWGFDGMVMTDWFGGQHTTWQMEAGNDLLMPGKKSQCEDLIKAVRSGVLSQDIINRNVRHILEYILRTPRFQGYQATNDPDLPQHAQITRASASEGMILLENKGMTLPLDKKAAKRIALFGCTSYDFIAGGTGSGDVNSRYTVSLSEGLKSGGFKLDKTLTGLYETYLAEQKKTLEKSEGFWGHRPRAKEMQLGKAQLAQAASQNQVAIVTIGKTSGEFLDRSIRSNFNLVAEEKELIQQVCEAFHARHKKVIVILNVCGVIETASWHDAPDAILLAWMGGQEGGNTVADILAGKVNPSGTFPMQYADVPSKDNFPDLDAISEEDMNKALQNFVDVRTSGDRKNFDMTTYEEGIFVGYRYYDTKNVPVAYPFGFGLSYTTFDYADASAQVEGDRVKVSLKVKNTGKVAGKEVVQIYVSAPGKDMSKPKKELKAFQKTSLLQPGETQELQFQIPVEALASFNEKESRWQVEGGQYQVQVAQNSRDVKVGLPVQLSERITETVQPLMLPVAEW